MITTLKLSSRIARGALLLALAAAAACSSDDITGNPGQPGTPDRSVATVQVTPDTATVVGAGGVRYMRARLLAADGTEVSGRRVTWSSEDSTIARMSGEMLTGLNSGFVWITATADGRQGRARIRVVPPMVTTLQLAAGGITLRAGDTGSPGITPYAADGRILHDAVVTLTSSDTSVVAVEGNMLRARRGGSAIITARADQAVAQLHVLVPAILEYQLTSLAGAALPAETPHVRTIAADSTFVEEWSRVVEGTLVLSTTSGEYVQRVTLIRYRRTGRVWRGEVMVDPMEQTGAWVYADRGTRVETPLSGDVAFTSTVTEGLRYYGYGNQPGRGLAVYQAPPRLAGQTWLYALR